jgi:hypothetical protein
MESLYGSIVLLLTKTGLISSDIVLNYGSFNLSFTGDELITQIAGWITIAAVLLVYGLYWMKGKNRGNNRGEAGREDMLDLAKYACLALLVFIIFNKVFSPQFMIWPLVFIWLFSGEKRYTLIGLYVIIAVGTTGFYAFLCWRIITDIHLPSIVILSARNLLTAMLCGLMVWSIKRDQAPVMNDNPSQIILKQT